MFVNYSALSIFLLIIASLLWGRLRFFKINSGTPLLLALSYDLAVAIQMSVTVYSYFTVTDITKLQLLFVLALYLLSLVLFWWAIFTARSLDFAFSDHVGNIVTHGPFGYCRHPFYVSYLLAWFGSTWLFNHWLLWASFVYLCIFYVLSARKEERMILKSDQSAAYKRYQQQVGMFVPRIKKWKQSSSKP